MNRKIHITLTLLFFLMLSCQKDDDNMEEFNECIDLEFMKGEWTGEFDQYNYGVYPMLMNVNNVEGCRFDGLLGWPELRNSVTTMEDFFRNDTLFWTEPTLLQGSNIVLNGLYVVPFSARDTLNGYWYYPNQPIQEGGVFSITKKPPQN